MPLLTSDSSQNPTCYFYFCCIIPEVHSARLESSLFKSLELENNHTHTHAHVCTRADVNTLKLVARLQLDTGALVFCQPQGKLAECSGEGEQRRAMLLTWQPSHHTKQVMSTDSTEICGILRRLHPLFISLHIIRTKARCNIITTKTYNLDQNIFCFVFFFSFVLFLLLVC